MASLEEHCRDCEAELGAPFRHVHEWLDELQPEYGPVHRRFRHHTGGVERVRARWGDAAARAAEIHVRKDTGGLLPTPEQLRDRWAIGPEEITPEESGE
ncbi:MAG: hypothetical protein JXR37_16280 [Kiritimatiellae bacterium]|nr:hypothetical protein [Kiritimatiellia bacterium]